MLVGRANTYIYAAPDPNRKRGCGRTMMDTGASTNSKCHQLPAEQLDCLHLLEFRIYMWAGSQSQAPVGHAGYALLLSRALVGRFSASAGSALRMSRMRSVAGKTGDHQVQEIRRVFDS
jgi:hypothetical protein